LKKILPLKEINFLTRQHPFYKKKLLPQHKQTFFYLDVLVFTSILSRITAYSSGGWKGKEREEERRRQIWGREEIGKIREGGLKREGWCEKADTDLVIKQYEYNEVPMTFDEMGTLDWKYHSLLQ